MDKFYVTYKFYDDHKRRLAIFAVPRQAPDLGEDFLEIWVVTCSPKDRFSKWKANKIFEGRAEGDSLKGYFQVLIKDKNKPKWTFIKWCEENYYKLVDAIFQMEAKVLVKDLKGENPIVMDDIDIVTNLIPIAIDIEVEGITVEVKEVESAV